MSTTIPAVKPIVLRGNTVSIDALAFSPDGQWLASGSRDGTSRLWNLSVPERVGASVVLTGDNARITSVAFSPDSRWLVTTQQGPGVRLDGTARLWSTSKPDSGPVFLRGERGHADSIDALAFGPDGRWLATGSADGTARLWDLSATDPKTRSVVLRVHGEAVARQGFVETSVRSLAFSRDGRWLAAGSSVGAVRMWHLADVNSATEPIVLRGEGNSAVENAVAFSPDGRWLAALGTEVTLWKVASPTSEPTVLRGREQFLDKLAFSPDSRWLVAGGLRDGTASLWNLSATDPPAESVLLQGDVKSGTVVAFSPDGRWLVTYGNGRPRLWNMNDPSAGSLVLEGSSRVAGFSPDGRWLATADKGGTRIWRLRIEELIALACQSVGRNLTPAESLEYFGTEDHPPTCPHQPRPK